ncbi:hypothetical protein [Paraliomyxa miuraensis]|uniref:hypothetical protein n=1 Tax=Paraliomyxa miuraensis TaxID=376150 RepID=UPI0022521F41|nr:hypothetical protein [Paraliomyxa miuraensis]MCX4244189.1 hypothetical protein [Paraliomyxa miuraensis]
MQKTPKPAAPRTAEEMIEQHATLAQVRYCRSYDHHVYFIADDGAEGWIALGGNAFAIAAAANATAHLGVKVMFVYSGYTPGREPGGGTFQSVLIAIPWLTAPDDREIGRP